MSVWCEVELTQCLFGLWFATPGDVLFLAMGMCEWVWAILKQ